jgi:hypothetical protein
MIIVNIYKKILKRNQSLNTVYKRDKDKGK